MDFRKAFIKIAAVLLMVCLNWAGLSSVVGTLAYFSDETSSEGNVWQAGILDFRLESLADFEPSPIMAGESATRTISIINLGNQHKYKITAVDFSNDVCDYLELEARLNSELEYEGSLAGFVNFGPTVFEDPAEWQFILTLDSDAPQEFLGQTCEFDFVFFGSQTRHNLPFGTGFTNTELITNTISTATPTCIPPQVTMIYPAGGEIWYLVPDGWPSWWCLNNGMNADCEYLLEWEAINTVGSDDDLSIDLYFSNDSGATWFHQIASGIENTGTYWWKPPAQNDFITENGRIRVVATYKDDPDCWAKDESDDFCPPMLDFDDLADWEDWEEMDEEVDTGGDSGSDGSGGGGSSCCDSDVPGQDEEDDVITDEEDKATDETAPESEEVTDEEETPEETEEKETEDGKESAEEETEEIFEQMPAEEEDPTDVPEDSNPEEKAPAEENSDQAPEETGDSETANDTSGSDETITEE